MGAPRPPRGFYFGRPASALSIGEAAFLAVLPRGPEAYDPFRHLDVALRRRGHILAAMEEARLVTAEEREVAEKTPLVFRREHPELRAPRTSSSTSSRRCRLAERDGATVETTLDGPLQRSLEVAVRAHLDAIGGRDVSQAGVVVLRNSDGAILAMVGSRDYFDAAHAGAVNVTTIRRRPGSTLKPFVYGLALEAGDSPATIAWDVVLPGETRETYTADVKQHGFGRYRETLAGSYNLAAVHTLARVGAPALARRLRAAGLTTLPPPDEGATRCRSPSARPSSASSSTRARSPPSATRAAPSCRAPSRACACPAAARASSRRARARPSSRPTSPP